MDRQTIYPLADNAEHAIPEEDEAWRGFEKVALHLGTDERLGFPLLHDITDTLRIGDVTFIKPGEPHATAELKTQVVGSEESEGGRWVTYHVEAIWAGEDPPKRVKTMSERPGRVPADAAPPRRSPKRRRTLKPEFGRQLRRMSKADALRRASDGQIIEHEDGRKSLTVMAPPYEGESHWKELRRLIREARRTGYASCVVEDALMYIALYRADGFETESQAMDLLSSMPSELAASNVLWREPEMRDRNRVAVYSVPPRGTRLRGPQLYMPYFLYPLPRRAILDLLNDRLMIMAVLNVGRLAAAVERRGLEVELADSDRDWSISPLVAWTNVELADGARYRVAVSGLHRHLLEMIMEAKPLDYFATCAESMAKGARATLPKELADRDRSTDLGQTA
jgi:hypothetical protein